MYCLRAGPGGRAALLQGAGLLLPGGPDGGLAAQPDGRGPDQRAQHARLCAEHRLERPPRLEARLAGCQATRR
eukprot:1181944-Prorocentrum_minimum.AAC.1